MREQNWVMLDNFKRQLFIKYELKKFIFKSISKNNNCKNSYKYLVLYKKNKLIRWSSISQQVNRCFLTGRQWAVFKSTRYSRFKFRTEAYQGNLPGFRKASW